MVSLTRLQDVERQLSTAATALQLHLRGLKSEREHIGWAQIAALALVCGRIEQVQSELRQSTTEILALARRSLAGGDATNKGEDTETEDEDENAELEGEQSVKGATRGQVEEAEAAVDQVQRCGEQDGASEEEEKQNEAVVKLEPVAITADFTRDGVVEEEATESDDGSSRQVVDEVEISGEKMIWESDVEVKREMISRSGSVEAGEQSSSDELEQLCDATVETNGVEVAVEEISRKKEEDTQEVGVEITEAGCRQGGLINYGKSKYSEATEESSEPAMENEGTAASDTRIAPNEAECEENHAEMHTGGVETTTAEPKTTESESVTESEAQVPRMDVKSADTSPIETTETSHQSRTTTMDTPDSKKDEERDGTTERIAHMNQWAKAVAELQSTALRDCLQAGNSVTAAVTDLISTTDRFLSEAMQREPKFNCRLWIKRMIVALNNLFEMINDPNVLEAFSALRENLPKLKRYCQKHYTDYISDMLNDLKSIKYLEQDGKLNSSILATSTRFVLDQLREDCVKYSAKLSPDNSASRDDEHWKQLMLICKHLVTWIKQIPLPHEQFPAVYLTQTIQVLGAFDAQIPKRIPVELLENMIFMVQHTKSNDSPRIAIENDPNTSSDKAVGRMNPIDRVNENRDAEQKPTKDAVVRGDFEETQHASVTRMESTPDRESITDQVESRNDRDREVQEEVVCESEVKNILKAANQKAADAINEFRRCLRNGNCTADGAVSLTIVVRDMTSAVTSHDSKYSRRMWIEEVVEACHWILRGVQGAELAQAISPLNEYCKQLQLYSSRFPDCLQDILNDIKYIDARQLISSQLASWLSRFLQRLRKNCCVYYQKVKGSTSELRSDEQWKLLMLICERISEWIKQLSPADSKKYKDDLQKALKTLTSFNKHFPDRIPTAPLEIMRHAVASSDVPKSADNSASKKRLREDSGCVEREQKKGAHHSSRDKFQPIAERYLQVARDAKIMIVDTGSRITEPSAAKAFSDLKAITTLANAELLKIFKNDDIPSANTTECYRLATQFMVETISNIPGNVVDYGWVGRTTLFLRQLLYLGESTILMNERDSISESISVVEVYLKATYEVEDDVVPSLDAIEARLHRFKTHKWDFRTVKRPIQSISSGLLVDVKKINALGPEKYLVRSAQNWSRFTAVCYALLVWTMRARKLAVPPSGLLNHLLAELLEFDAKYPGKLPPSLISNCQAISR